MSSDFLGFGTASSYPPKYSAEPTFICHDCGDSVTEIEIAAKWWSDPFTVTKVVCHGCFFGIK